MKMPSLLRAALSAAAVLLVPAAAPASAASLTGQEVLEQFNLVVFGNLDSNSEVEGRTFVGGNLSGSSSNYFVHGDDAPPSVFAALTVAGNVTGNAKQVNNGGDMVVGGNLDTQVNMNGGGTRHVGGNVTVGQNGPASSTVKGPVAIPSFRTVMTDLSGELSQHAPTSVAATAGNRATFSANPDSDGTAIFLIDDGNGFFASVGEIFFVMNDAETVIINVGGAIIAEAENFLGSAALKAEIASKVIWNFYEATSITFGTEFWGSVLAPNAAITNTNAINGTVVVNDFTQRGEVHLPGFAGDLPGDEDKTIEVAEPATSLLLIGGLAGLAALRRRRAA